MTWAVAFRSGVARLCVVALLAATVALAAGSGPAGAVENPPPFVTKWGTPGTGNSQFNLPNGVAVDGDGNVYVVDSNNNRVQKFTSTGTLITQWGTPGTGNGQFNSPLDVAVDGAGNVYVADSNNNRVQKFTSTGTLITQWGTPGFGDGQFAYPSGIAVDGDGNVYVVNSYLDNRVQKFTSTGTLITTWVTGGRTNGGPFFRSLAVDTDGYVYVTDRERNWAEKFTSTGTFVPKWGTNGTSNGQFDGPAGVAVDIDGNVYVADSNNSRVQKFTSTGTFLTAWGSWGTRNGQFKYPQGVAVDSDGNLYVTDSGNDRVQKFGLVPRPDGRIRKGLAGALVGNNIYNTTGTNQARTGSAARGGTVTYHVSVQNDAPINDVLRVQGTATNTRFKVKYSVDGTDITPLVTAGTYTTPTLDPGATHLVKVQVTVRSTAPAGSSLSATVTIRSNSELTRRDTVSFVTSRT